MKPMKLKFNLFNRQTGNVVSSLVVTWASLMAMGYIPDNKYTHMVQVVMAGLQLFMLNMGFNRTPNGTVIPEPVVKLVDAVDATKPDKV